MKYIRFYNPMTESMTDGFLVQQTNDTFTTIDPVCYEWLAHTEQWDWVQHVKGRTFDTASTPFAVSPTPPLGTFSADHAWLFTFPMKESYLPSIHAIAHYMEWFIHEASRPLEERLTTCRYYASPLLETTILEALETFIRDYEKTSLL